MGKQEQVYKWTCDREKVEAVQQKQVRAQETKVWLGSHVAVVLEENKKRMSSRKLNFLFVGRKVSLLLLNGLLTFSS